tara:strand:+ start:17537 stop:18196 length:660 start_codon:yes stop_codon:yes gene_type:complete
VKKALPVLKGIGSKIAVLIGLIASATAILTVDFSPPLPTTRVSYMNVIDQRLLDDGSFSTYIHDNHPDYYLRAADNTATTADLNGLNLPDRFRGSFISVENHGSVEIEDLTVSFTFYDEQKAIFTETFAGELTLGPGRENSARFHEPSARTSDYVEVCLQYDGALPFEQVTERYLIPIKPLLLVTYDSKAEYDRFRKFFIKGDCHTPPKAVTIQNSIKY